MRTLVIDNGSHEIKLGWSDTLNCLHVKNAMMRSRDRRLWLGNAIDSCKDLTGLHFRRPIERGQLYSWELEKAIWDWTWDSNGIVDSVDEFKDSTLLLSESPGSLPSSSGNTDQIIFEEYEFDKYRRTFPQVLAANASQRKSDVKLVVDLGFHATHVVPVLDRINAIASGIQRLDVGGKILTNYLKETVSYRHYNMMEESAILARIKERCCFVSNNFKSDLLLWRQSHEARKFSKFAFSYALPSTHEDPYGHLITSLEDALAAQKSGEEQVLILENERFSVPEALFDPNGHLGLDQSPLPEVIVNSIRSCPSELQPLLWSNIIICGGTANLPNIKTRLWNELRKWCPSELPLHIEEAATGINTEAAWQGGCNLANDDDFGIDQYVVSRQEYLEFGPSHVSRKFASSNYWKPK